MKILNLIMVVFVLAVIVGCEKATTEDTTTTMQDTTTTMGSSTTTIAEELSVDDIVPLDDGDLEINLSELDY